MDIETTPPQPDEVAQVIGEALAEDASKPDPWWQAGLEEALGE